jgi:hypothetical protein
VARLDFEGGATAQVTLAPDAGAHAETYELLGPEYRVRVDVTEPRLSVSAAGDTVLDWSMADAPAYVRNGTLAETVSFLAAARDGEGFEPTLSEGLATMRTVEALAAGGEHHLG